MEGAFVTEKSLKTMCRDERSFCGSSFLASRTMAEPIKDDTNSPKESKEKYLAHTKIVHSCYAKFISPDDL